MTGNGNPLKSLSHCELWVATGLAFPFLAANKLLYMRVGRSVGPSVSRFFIAEIDNSDKSDISDKLTNLQIWQISLQFHLSSLLKTHLCSNELVLLRFKTRDPPCVTLPWKIPSLKNFFYKKGFRRSFCLSIDLGRGVKELQTKKSKV